MLWKTVKHVNVAWNKKLVAWYKWAYAMGLVDIYDCALKYIYI